MSKLCCPVCWELLKVLRDKTETFNVRGRHCTISPIDLPAWLPKADVREMITRFRFHLKAEVVSMMRTYTFEIQKRGIDKLSSRHTRTPSESVESDGLSVSSGSSFGYHK